jgi:AcrR family transcriptional regulator
MPERKPSTQKTRTSTAVGYGPRDERGVISDRILSIARASFAEHGYAGTSLRGVARQAGVDPALVNYYFQTKSGLLEAALVPPPGWTESVAASAASPLKRRGASLVQTMIAAWEDPPTSEFLRSAILTAAHEPIALQRLATNFAAYILDAVSAELSDTERAVRASLVSSQIVGLAMTRYVWKVGALATMPTEQVVNLIAPTIQGYLTGKLDP